METPDSPDSPDPSKPTPPETAPSSEATEPPVDRDAVRKRLDRVHDPELDRSIVDLQYVEDVDIDGGGVTVTFVLPTAWCSPAFAWMMATGIRDEVGDLPGVASVTVRLSEHMRPVTPARTVERPRLRSRPQRGWGVARRSISLPTTITGRSPRNSTLIAANRSERDSRPRI